MFWPSKSDSQSMEAKEYRASNGDGVTDAKKIVQKTTKIEFHPINSSMYDGSWSIPSTYEVKSHLTQRTRILAEECRN